MRLAVISDIHSNLEALERVLDHLRKEPVDGIVCLGDIVGYGADPNECVEIVRERCSVVLLGNHDLAAVDPSYADSFTANAQIAAQWTAEVLEPEHRKFLKELPYTATIKDTLLVHSSPLEPEQWHYIFTLQDARRMFGSFSESLCFVGHSHVPGVHGESSLSGIIKRSERFLVNVGSVGQPRDGNPALSFGLFDSKSWEYKNIRLAYDVERASRKILDAGLPRGLAERIRIGV